MVVAWQYMSGFSMEDVGRATLKLLSQRPSALPRFEDLCESRISSEDEQTELWSICGQVRAEQPHSESLLPYVSVCPQTPACSDPTFFHSLLQPIDSLPTARSPSFCGRRHILNLFIVYTLD